MNVTLWGRDFQAMLAPPKVALIPETYGWAAVGGPHLATIRAIGPAEARWELVAYLRCPVEITNDAGEAVWWGYVAEVEVEEGAITARVSLDDLANRVAVAYAYTSLANTIGTRGTTAWAQDDLSVDEYGTFERLDSSAASEPDLADAQRDQVLAQYAYPVTGIGVRPGGAGSGATLRCRGWFTTLARRMWDNPGEHTVVDLSVAERTFVVSGALGHLFTAGAPLEVGGSTYNNGSYTVVSSAQTSDGGGNLLTEIVVVEAIPEQTAVDWPVSNLDQGGRIFYVGGWETDYFPAGGSFSLSGSTGNDGTYTVVSSAQRQDGEGNHRTEIVVAEEIPSAVVDGTITPTIDYGYLMVAPETTAQIVDIVREAGEFLTGVDILDPSGLYLLEVRDGDTNAQEELEQLLQHGTTGGRRLLCEVTRERVLRVYEEPAPGARDLLLRSDGSLRDYLDAPLPAGACPVGRWARLVDVIPATVNTSVLADPSRVFIERLEWDCARGRFGVIEPRGASAFEVSRVERV